MSDDSFSNRTLSMTIVTPDLVLITLLTYMKRRDLVIRSVKKVQRYDDLNDTFHGH